MELRGKLVQQVNQSLCGCGEALANGLSPTACSLPFLLPLLPPWETSSGVKRTIFPSKQQKPTSQPIALPLQVLSTFNDVVWHASWSITGDILAISGGDNKVGVATCILGNCCHENRSGYQPCMDTTAYLTLHVHACSHSLVHIYTLTCR